MKYWLMKSEPDVYSIDHLAAEPNQTDYWDGIRNYQVRNFIRDDMELNDAAFFYHSRCDVPGIGWYHAHRPYRLSRPYCV